MFLKIIHVYSLHVNFRVAIGEIFTDCWII